MSKHQYLSIEMVQPGKEELLAFEKLHEATSPEINRYAKVLGECFTEAPNDEQFSLALFSMCIGMDWLQDNNQIEALKRICIGCLEDICEASRVTEDIH